MTAKLWIRGTISNSLGLGVLFGVSYLSASMPQFVAVALGMQYLVFLLHGLPYSSEKYYDLSGSATHFAVVAASLVSASRARSPRQMLTALLSTVWLTRLGSFLYLRIKKDGKDERFEPLKPVWLSFLGAWTIQAAWVVLIQLPVLLLNGRDDALPTNAVDVLALSLWLVGFLIECAADIEKFTFRLDPANKNKFITEGIWRYSRHPNYFGEILMWTAMALDASAAGVAMGSYAALGAWISPLFTAVLLLKVSGVPMVEAAGEKKWGTDPEYRAYMEGTSCLVPWFPKTATPKVPLTPSAKEQLLDAAAPRS